MNLRTREASNRCREDSCNVAATRRGGKGKLEAAHPVVADTQQRAAVRRSLFHNTTSSSIKGEDTIRNNVLALHRGSPKSPAHHRPSLASPRSPSFSVQSSLEHSRRATKHWMNVRPKMMSNRPRSSLGRINSGDSTVQAPK